MSTSQQQIQNDNIAATIEQSSGCRVRLDVTATPLAAQAAYHKAIKTIAKEVSLPGFRKGKAPDSLILQNFGKAVEKEWKDILLNTAFQEAIELTKVYPFNKESINKANLKKISLQEGASLHYEYESFPEVPNVDPKELSITVKERISLTENDVNQAIENLRLQHAQWEEISGRPAAEHDFVNIDIDAVEEPMRNICENSPFELTAGKMGSWMRELIIGMNPGESKDGMSRQEHEDCKQCETGEHYHEPEGNFTPSLCRITLRSIQKPTLPTLDEAFFKKLGVNDTEQLRERLSIELKKQEEEQYNTYLRQSVENSILNKYAFEIPYSLVEGQIEEQATNIVEELKNRGATEEAIEIESQKIKKDVENRLSHNFRIYFIAQKIAQDQNIQVVQDDLMQELMRQVWLQQSGSGQSIINQSMDSKEVRSRLYAHILVTKAMDYLIEHTQKNHDS